MKRWALLTIGLYAAILLLLTVPMFMAYGVKWSLHPSPHVEQTESLEKAFGLYREWGYWIWLGVLVLGEALLLFVPVRLAGRRMTSRRHVLVPVVTAAFLFASVLFSAVFAVASAIFGDRAGSIFELFGNGDGGTLAAALLYPLVLWAI